MLILKQFFFSGENQIIKQPKFEDEINKAEINESKSDVEEIRPSSTEGENRPHIPHSIPSMMNNPFFPRLNPALLNSGLQAGLPQVSSAGMPPTHHLMAHLHRMNSQRMMGAHDPRVPNMPLGLPRFGHFSHNGKKFY